MRRIACNARRRCRRVATSVLALMMIAALASCSQAGSSDGSHGEEGRREATSEESAGVDRDVALSPGAIERLGVRWEASRMGSLSSAFAAPAEIQANPDRVARITPLLPGRVERVHVELGAHVAEGDDLVTLMSTEIGEARAQLRQARTGVEVADANLVRQQTLRDEGIASGRAVLEAQLRSAEAEAALESARSRLHVLGVEGGRGSLVTLTSPLTGVVTQRSVTRGERAGTDISLLTVADLSRVWVIARVPEGHVGSVELGSPATLTLRAYPGRSWRGTVNYVANTLDEESRTLPVRVELENVDGLLRPGSFGTLTISSPPGPPAVPIVPESALVEVAGQAIVFVRNPDGPTFRAEAVLTGTHQGGEIEVVEGLAEGDLVVVEGAFILKSQLLREQLAEGDED